MDYTGRRESELWQMLEDEIRSAHSIEDSVGILTLWSVARLVPKSGVLDDVNFFYQQTKEMTGSQITQEHGAAFHTMLYDGLPILVEKIFQTNPNFIQIVPKKILDKDPEARRQFYAAFVRVTAKSYASATLSD
jgi:hypothetical protein